MILRIVRVILETLFWMIAAAIVPSAGYALFAIGAAPAAGGLGVLGALLLIPVLLRVTNVTRQNRSMAVLSHLEQAVRLNLPLPRMLWAAQRSEAGKTAERLARLRLNLEAGLPIDTALELSAPEVPARSIALIGSAQRLGRLPQVLRRLLDEQTRIWPEDVANSVFYRVYPAVMLLVISGTMTIFAVYVLPKFFQIFRDFGVKLPQITVWTYDTAASLAPVLFAVILAGVLFSAGRSLWETLHPARPDVPGLRKFRDHVLWRLPLAHNLQRDRGLADAFEVIGEALAAGVTAPRALEEAAQLRINEVLRQRMRRFAAEVSAGRSMQEAAREARMPALVVGLLGPSRGMDAAEVFRFLSRYYASRFSRLMILIEAAGIPLMVFFFAVIVTVVALSLFMPLLTIINAVSVGTHRL
jgi:type IV pilus assembly protein PilC